MSIGTSILSRGFVTAGDIGPSIMSLGFVEYGVVPDPGTPAPGGGGSRRNTFKGEPYSKYRERQIILEEDEEILAFVKAFITMRLH